MCKYNTPPGSFPKEDKPKEGMLYDIPMSIIVAWLQIGIEVFEVSTAETKRE